MKYNNNKVRNIRLFKKVLMNLDNIKDEIVKLNKTNLVRLANFVNVLIEDLKSDNPQHYYSITYYLKNEEKVKENVSNWRKTNLKKMR